MGALISDFFLRLSLKFEVMYVLIILKCNLFYVTSTKLKTALLKHSNYTGQ